jgi:hypothetical protein
MSLSITAQPTEGSRASAPGVGWRRALGDKVSTTVPNCAGGLERRGRTKFPNRRNRKKPSVNMSSQRIESAFNRLQDFRRVAARIIGRQAIHEPPFGSRMMDLMGSRPLGLPSAARDLWHSPTAGPADAAIEMHQQATAIDGRCKPCASY